MTYWNMNEFEVSRARLEISLLNFCSEQQNLRKSNTFACKSGIAVIEVEDAMKELQRKSLATAEFDETLGSTVSSVHDLQGFLQDVS